MNKVLHCTALFFCSIAVNGGGWASSHWALVPRGSRMQCTATPLFTALRLARLRLARLRLARLRSARLRSARLRSARLRSARLRSARLRLASALGRAYRSRGGVRGAKACRVLVAFRAAVSAVAVDVRLTGAVLAGRLHRLGTRPPPPPPAPPRQWAGALRRGHPGDVHLVI